MMNYYTLLIQATLQIGLLGYTDAIGESGCASSTDLSSDSDRNLYSPNYPNSYDKNVQCDYRIKLSAPTKFTFEVKYMNLEDTTSCTNDYLMLGAFDDHYDITEWFRLCGNQTGTYVSPEARDFMFMKFKADSVDTGATGFHLKWDYETISTETAPTTVTNTAVTTTTDPATKDPATKDPATATEDWVIAVAVVGSIVGVIVLIVLTYCLCCRKNAPCKCSDEEGDRSSAQMTWAKSNPQIHPQQQQPVVPMMPITSFKRFDASELTAPATATQEDVKPKKKRVRRRRKISSDEDDDDDGKPHIMISYQWDVKPQVLEFRALLKEYGYRVWIDVEKMHKNASTFESMASAVENATVVIPVLTDKYQQSFNCRKEIEYADKQKRRLIPIRMENDFEISGWLSFLLGSAQSFDFANPESVKGERANFFKLLKSAAVEAKMEEKDNQDEL